MPKVKKTTDKQATYLGKVKTLKGTDYEVLGNYVNSKTRIEILHRPCQYKWSPYPGSFLRTKYGCPRCAGNERIDTSTYKNKVKALVGDEYEIIGEYLNARTPVLKKHNLCGYLFETTPYSFTNMGTRCPKCRPNYQPTNEEFVKEVILAVGSEYTFTDTYVISQTPIGVTHNCGYSWRVSPANFLAKKSRCPKCAGNAKYTQDEFTKKVYDSFGDEYTFIEDYINYVTAILCRHECGLEWDIAPNNLFQGKRCPRCYNDSKGERLVRCILSKSKHKFTTQKTFDGCAHEKLLRFDFYIPELNTCIEYDGEQHYRPVDFSGKGTVYAIKEFELTKKRDGIKNKYCRDNNINLIRIPYYLTDGEIEEVIDNLVPLVGK